MIAESKTKWTIWRLSLPLGGNQNDGKQLLCRSQGIKQGGSG